MGRLRVVVEHLAAANRHVRRGEVHLNRQRRVLKTLEEDGHPQQLAEAKKLLRLFEELQAMHIADRDRLLDELATLRPEGADPH